jgi:hypothetical protein
MAWCLVKHRDNFTFYLYLKNYEPSAFPCNESRPLDSFKQRFSKHAWAAFVICSAVLCSGSESAKSLCQSITEIGVGGGVGYGKISWFPRGDAGAKNILLTFWHRSHHFVHAHRHLRFCSFLLGPVSLR